MGDAGSTLIGFTGSGSCSKRPRAKLIPSARLPFVDYRHSANGYGGDYVPSPAKGMSPFSPDRQHIHHLIMRAGLLPARRLC